MIDIRDLKKEYRDVSAVSGISFSVGRGEIVEALAVEDRGLEGRPEGLDLAVRPGRVDLGPDVADLELGEGALEAAEHRPHDRDEGRAVVRHQRVGDAAQLDGLGESLEDRDGLLRRDGMDPEQVAAEVVDEGARLPNSAAIRRLFQ